MIIFFNSRQPYDGRCACAVGAVSADSGCLTAYRRRQIAGTAPPGEVRRINDEGQPLGTNCKGWNCSKTVQVALQNISLSAHLTAAVGFRIYWAQW